MSWRVAVKGVLATIVCACCGGGSSVTTPSAAVAVDVAPSTCSTEHHTNRIGDVSANSLVLAGTDGLMINCRVAPVDVRRYRATGTIIHGGATPLSVDFDGTFEADTLDTPNVSMTLNSGLLPEIKQPGCHATLDPARTQGVGAGRLYATIHCDASCPVTVDVRVEDCAR